MLKRATRTTTQQHAVSQRALKALRAQLATCYGDVAVAVFDACIDKHDVQLHSWRSAAAVATCSVVVSAGVPLVVTCNNEDGDARAQPLPTVFFLLAYARHEVDGPASTSQQQQHAAPYALVRCHASTAAALVRGASLMMPGIVDARVRTRFAFSDNDDDDEEHDTATTKLTAGMLALVVTTACAVPFAVGRVTSALAQHARHGVGVEVLHCVDDALWCAYVRTWRGVLPPGFASLGDAAAATRATEGAAVAADAATSETPADDDEGSKMDGARVSSNNDDSRGDDDDDLFASDDEVLLYCLCEAVKRCASLTLPISFDQFMGLFWAARPAGSARAAALHGFRQTRHKTAQAYVGAFASLVSVRAKPSGACCKVVHVARSHALLDAHARTCAALQERLRATTVPQGDATTTARDDDGEVAPLRVVDAVTPYRTPRRGLSARLERLLLLGETDDNDATAAEALPYTVGALHGESYDTRSGAYRVRTAKLIAAAECEARVTRHIAQYVKAHALAQHDVTASSSSPSTQRRVRLCGVLRELGSKDSDECTEDELVALALRQFADVTVVTLRDTDTQSCVPFAWCGVPAPVHVSVHKVRGHLLTHVAHLDQYGYELADVCRCMSTHLGIGGTLQDGHDATAASARKSGRHVVRVLALQGNCSKRVVAFLTQQLRLPAACVHAAT